MWVDSCYPRDQEVCPGEVEYRRGPESNYGAGRIYNYAIPVVSEIVAEMESTRLLPRPLVI